MSSGGASSASCSMSCAAGDECKALKNAPGIVSAPNHSCRAGCGGVLHGFCGTNDPQSDNEMHRICPSCFVASSKGKGKGKSADGKRKPAQGLGVAFASATKKKPRQSATRARLTFHIKAKMLEDIENGSSHAAVAKRYGCSVRAVSRCVHDKQKIMELSNKAGLAGQMKSMRGPQHSKVRRTAGRANRIFQQYSQ